MNPEQKITKAKAGLLMDAPFFGSIVCRWKISPDTTIKTGCCDSKTLDYNPEWIDGLTLSKVKGFLAHEALHIANGHHLRRGERDPAGWNVATDKAINKVLIDNGFDLPEDGLISYDDKSAEQHYEDGKRPDPDGDPDDGDGQGDGDGQAPPDPGGNGGIKDLTGEDDQPLNDAERKQAETDAKVDLAQAAQIAKNMGLLPGGLSGLVDNILYPTLDFEQLLQRFVQRSARDNYSWNPPNRRYISLDLILPSLRSDSLKVIIAADTSGSTYAYLDLFNGAVNRVLSSFGKVEVTVIYCDAQIQGEPEHLETHDLPVNIEMRGGGGTRFEPVFDYVEEENLDPDALIYLTDLYGSFPDTAPDYPVLWAATSDETAPFGETYQL